MGSESLIGKRVDHFTILREIGRGGMGVVYLAEDLQLKRRVALKFLTPESTSNPVAVERFMREAQAAASLSHPSIVTVYEIGTYEGQRYIVMEYVEGQTLRWKIASGRIAVDETVAIARQMCKGLSAAHRRGIVHRDIKPENLLLNEDGQLKILDFGIAKLRGAKNLTRDLTVGTTWYMPPEQLRAEEADHRADIWAAGVVLYEMLAGRPPFRGEMESSVIHSILNDDPIPLRDLRDDVPEGVDGAIMRALAKNPADRFARIDEFAAILSAGVRPTLTTATRRALRSVTRRRFPWLIPLIVAGLAVAAVWFATRRSGPGVETPPDQVTFLGNVRGFDLSPGGGAAVYVAQSPDGGPAVFAKDLGTGSATQILGASSISAVAWSPDDRRIAVSAGIDDSTAGVFLLAPLGGARQLVFPRALPGLAWSPDGSTLALWGYARRSITFVRVETKDTTSLRLADSLGSETGLCWADAPDGLVLTTIDSLGSALWWLSRDGKRTVLLLRRSAREGVVVGNPCWMRGMRRLAYLERNPVSGVGMVKRVSLGGDGRMGGEPSNYLQADRLIHSFRASSDGERILYLREFALSNLVLYRRDGRSAVAVPLTQGTGLKSRGALSADGSAVAFTMADNEGTNLYVMRLPREGGTAGGASTEKVSSRQELAFQPAWSPDGKAVAFVSATGGGFHLHIARLDGGELRAFDQANVLPMRGAVVWQPGEKVLFPSQPDGSYRTLDPATGEIHSITPPDSGDDVTVAVWGPGGREVAVGRGAGLDVGPPGGPWRRVARDAGLVPIQWSFDGSLIYVVRRGETVVRTLRVSDGRLAVHARLPLLQLAPDMLSVSADGNSFLYTNTESVRDLCIIDRGKRAEVRLR